MRTACKSIYHNGLCEQSGVQMKLKIFVAVGFLFFSCKAQEAIPSHIGGFTVKVTPPGNESYVAQPRRVEQGKLPEFIKQKVRALTPAGGRISSWKLNNEKGYSVSSAAGEDRYPFSFTSGGVLTNLSYRNYPLFKQEHAARMIIRGTKQSVPRNQVPANAFATLEKIGLNPVSSQTFVTNTIEGKRFIIVLDGMAYFVRPDG